MAESGGPLTNEGSPVNGNLPVVSNLDQLIVHVIDFQNHIDLDLLIPELRRRNIITGDQQYELKLDRTSPQQRINQLITEILPGKGGTVLEAFKEALRSTLEADGSLGHQTLLERYFGENLSHSDGAEKPTVYTISDESEEFSILLMEFTKILENGNDKEVAKRLREVANYLCHLKCNNPHKSFLIKQNVRAELFSNDLTFSKLFNYLHSSDPPIISYNDVSMLCRIVDKVLKLNENCKKIIEPLKQLLDQYKNNTSIAPSPSIPEIPIGSARIKTKIKNASSSGPKLKNGVKKSLWHSFKLNFRGSGIGSVIFYWDFPEEFIQQVKESFDSVCKNKTELHQLKITKVEAQLDQRPYQINLDMEITDPVLLQSAGKRRLVADRISRDQEMFILFLMKIDHLVGTCADMFLSTSRKELSRPYAQFQGSSFKEMTDVLISEEKLHCYDISYIQQFLLSLLKWDTSQSCKYKESITTLLTEAQEYEPVSPGHPLPSLHSHHSRSHAIQIVTLFFDVHDVSYEVMMTLKYALMQLLYLSLSAFQYVRWIKVNNGCQITWKTLPENFEKIENKLKCLPSTGALKVREDCDIEYPYKITFSCKIKRMQLLLDGSPLLCPELEG